MYDVDMTCLIKCFYGPRKATHPLQRTTRGRGGGSDDEGKRRRDRRPVPYGTVQVHEWTAQRARRAPRWTLRKTKKETMLTTLLLTARTATELPSDGAGWLGFRRNARTTPAGRTNDCPFAATGQARRLARDQTDRHDRWKGRRTPPREQAAPSLHACLPGGLPACLVLARFIGADSTKSSSGSGSGSGSGTLLATSPHAQHNPRPMSDPPAQSTNQSVNPSPINQIPKRQQRLVRDKRFNGMMDLRTRNART
jgi:hypothetical protein